MKHSFEKYCKDYEKIENYEKAKKDNFKGWECHHRLETHTPDGKRRDVDISHKELKALNLYYHRPPEELIFLTTREHNAYGKGKKRSEETRKKIGAASKGNKYRLGKKMSEEAKNKISEAMKGENNPMYGKHHSEESKKKNSEAHKGQIPWNKGKQLSEETKKKMCEANKGKNIGNTNVRGTRWFNNGEKCVRAKECPDGFTPGRIKKL